MLRPERTKEDWQSGLPCLDASRCPREPMRERTQHRKTRGKYGSAYLHIAAHRRQSRRLAKKQNRLAGNLTRWPRESKVQILVNSVQNIQLYRRLLYSSVGHRVDSVPNLWTQLMLLIMCLVLESAQMPRGSQFCRTVSHFTVQWILHGCIISCINIRENNDFFIKWSGQL